MTDASLDAATCICDPCGNIAVASTDAATTPFKFAGQYADPETGFQYLRARYYDPATGQFLNRDPIEPLTRDPYGYGLRAPTSFTDPSGLGSCLLGSNDDLKNGRCASQETADLANNVGTIVGVVSAGLLLVGIFGIPFLGAETATTFFLAGEAGGNVSSTASLVAAIGECNNQGATSTCVANAIAAVVGLSVVPALDAAAARVAAKIGAEFGGVISVLKDTLAVVGDVFTGLVGLISQFFSFDGGCPVGGA